MDWAAFRAQAPMVELLLRYTPRHPVLNADKSLGECSSNEPSVRAPMIYSAKTFSSIFLAADSGDRASTEALLNSLDDPQQALGDKGKLKAATMSMRTLLGKADRGWLSATGQFPNATPSVIMTEKLSTKLLETAIICNQLTLVKILVELGSSLGAIEGETRGRLPLHVAASSGDWQICNYLLSKGADASLRDTTGRSLLDLAISSRDMRCIKGVYLASGPLQPGADPKDLMAGFIRASSARGQHSTVRGIRRRIRLLFRPRLPLESLHTLESVQTLDVKRPVCCERHFSCYPESSPSRQETRPDKMIDFLRLLLARGYDINQAGLNEDNTPLHDACWAVGPDVVKYLLANGAEVNSRDKSDESPLHIVCARLTPTSEALDNGKDIIRYSNC